MTSPDDKTVIAAQPAPDAPLVPSGTDDERTVVIPKRPAAVDTSHALPVGTRLAEFEIVRLIGEGGFGIVYLAHDTQLGRDVALKEYIPAALASRARGAEVTVKSERHEETFRAGLKSFINEARLLAQFDHHSLVKVYRFWEANGTAYMVMPYYEGATLRDALRQMDAPPDEAWLRALLGPLVEALAVLHAAQCYHRDIAPDNIMLLKGSGRPLLLDFGAARRVIGDMTQALTVILKPGYAPVEQYAEVPSMKQGPWTDLYALAAVVYFAIQGKTPPAAVGRLMSDTYQPLATEAAGRYSEPFLRAIDHALAVQPQDRPQDVAELADELGLATGDTSRTDGAAAAPASGSVADRMPAGTAGARTQGGPSAAPASRAEPRTADAAPAADRRGMRPATIAAVAAGVVAAAGIGGWWATRPAPPAAPSSGSAATHSAATSAAPTPPVAPPPAANPVPPQQEAASAATSVAGTTASAPAPVANATPVAPPVTASAGTPPPVAPLPPFTPGGELERIASLADPSFHVTTTLRNTIARINRDHLEFRLSSGRAGYAYVFMVDPAGQYLMLFPNELDKNNAIAAGQTLTLPRASWPMLAGPPAGPNRFLAIVSSSPRDFVESGLHPGAVFASFPAHAQRAAAARRTAARSPFAGRPRCGASDCPDAFGAATFTIDVVDGSK